MNRYENSIPRAACGIAAAAMTAMTIGLFVVAPAKTDSASNGVRTLAASKVLTPASAEVAISPAHINVVAAREPNLVSVQLRSVQLKLKQQI
jgi:hypothetical protein